MKLLAAVLAALAMACVAGIFFLYYKQTRSAAALGSVSACRQMRIPKAHRCTRTDAILALVITVVYAFVGFSNLGDNTAPQTFYRMKEPSPSVTFDLRDEYLLGGITYYTGSYHDPYGNYKGYDLQLSVDGEHFYDYGLLSQTHANTFHWVTRTFTNEDITEYGTPSARYVRITANYFPMELGEIFFIDSTTGAPIDSTGFKSSPIDAVGKLTDEQQLLPAESNYRNSMYFDEIYHARTAREFINGDRVYENTHPPLGKTIISLGVRMFGMTPFGWRFMGVLFGVLMLPFTYVFVKNMFGKTWLASCATTVFAFDFMHYAQTRIATIDTYGLFFTILMYFFMYRFLAAGYDAPARSRLVPLALCGVSFGLGIASKWTCFYAAAGLVVLYIIGAVLEGRRLYAEDRKAEFWKKFAVVIGVSVVFFVVVGFGIYYLSYIPFCRSNGKEFNFANVWANQTSMWNYHSKLVATHSYQSSWWQWMVDGRPILYFSGSHGDSRAMLASFNSPLVSWAGLIAMVTLVASLYRSCSKRAKAVGGVFAALALVGFAVQVITFFVSGQTQYTNQTFNYVFALGILGATAAPFAAGHFAKRDDGYDAPDARTLFIVVGALAQLLSWIAVTRCTFAYHYFPTSFFLVLAIAAVFDRWDDMANSNAAASADDKPAKPVIPLLGKPSGKRSAAHAQGSTWNVGSRAKRLCVYFTVGCVALFALYYPALTGLYAPSWYHTLVKWFPSWPV